VLAQAGLVAPMKAVTPVRPMPEDEPEISVNVSEAEKENPSRVANILLEALSGAGLQAEGSFHPRCP
jgi:hypothetical protein